MELIVLCKLFTSIGDGLILFYLIYAYTHNTAYTKMIFSGVCAGVVFHGANIIYLPFSLQNCIFCIVTYLLTGWALLKFTQAQTRFRDYLFIFSAVYFSNIGGSIIAILLSIVMGISLVELVDQSPLHMLLVNFWLYSIVLASGLFILRKKDQIQVVSAIGTATYVNISVAAIFFSTLFLSLTTIIDKSTSRSISLAEDPYHQTLLEPTLTVLMISLLYVFFFILSRYTFRHEILKARLTHQEIITDGLTSVVEELHPLTQDMRNRFEAIHALAASESQDALSEYVESCTENFSLHSEPCHLAASRIMHLGLSALISSTLREIQQENIPLDFSTEFHNSLIDMRVSDLCDIMGVFIDNAREASREMGSKAHMRILLSNDDAFFVASIENYYTKPVSVEKIFHKGYSSKGAHRGIGLWHAQLLLQSYPHAAHSCQHKDGYFIQTITIQNHRAFAFESCQAI